MKKIYFTIVLFAIGFIATAIFASFNYHKPFIGDGGINSMADGIYSSGEVFDIEDKKDNLGFPNAERVVSINYNDSVQIGGVSDTPGMLAVTGTDGEAGYAVNDSTSPPPEPTTIFLFGSGLIGLGVFGRKKLKRS